MAVSGSDIANFAQQYLGTPYVWGGNSLTSGVDCSGLVQQVYSHFGLSVPRTTYQQIGVGKAINMNQLQAGDMVFFDTNPSIKGPDHVGLYIGNGKMIEAPKPGEKVRVTDITSGYYYDSFVGARRVSGITGGGPSSDWNPGVTGAAARLSPTELASQYGWSYAFLNSQPDLKKLFGEAVDQSWSADQFQAQLRGTKWWQDNSNTMRQAALQKSTDPATYNANVSAARIQVQDLASQMGAAISVKQLDSIADQVVTTGLNEEGLRNVLGQYIKFGKSGNLNGDAGTYENNIKQVAYNQGVTLSDQTIKNQAALIGRGLATQKDFENQIQQQAASAYPAYKNQLAAGSTMMDIAQPYIQSMSQGLEIPAQGIGLTDPLVKQALNGLDDKGQPTGMDQVDFQSLVRNDPRWKATQNAQDSLMSAGTKVLTDMGLIAKG